MSPSMGSRLAVLGWQALRATDRAASVPSAPSRGLQAALAAGHPRWNSSFGPRHGKAIEPEAWEAMTQPARDGQGTNKTVKSVVKAEQAPSPSKPEDAAAAPEPEPPQAEAGGPSRQDGEEKTERHPEKQDKHQPAGPLDEVLHVEPPEPDTGKKHHNLKPPPYVHHFDSYSLVRQLQDEGYSKGQSIEAMKGIRSLLAQNIEVAQQSLHSKSQVENETYLFRAACSELRQEIKNNRRLQDEQIRQQRAHLQHEVDILTQSLNQAVLTLNDNVRGMFNDRRMAVREEQKTADSAIQQINYKISTSLVSDSKSEIEGVRWVLIRRSALGIFFMAMATLGSVRYATYKMNEQREEEKRRKEAEELARRSQQDAAPADPAAILAAN